MSDNLIITIGRECGSGGRMIGMKLAERLGIKAYDKELLLLAARESGLSKEILEHHDEKPTNSFLYSLVTDNFSSGYAAAGYFDMPLNQKAFLAQFDTIKKLADQESCVMIGRCADYALADYPNVVRVFVSGNTEDRLKLTKEAFEVSDGKVKDFMCKTDKKRASYYNYYTNQKWGSAASYDLCINSSAVGYDGAVDTILNFIECKKRYMSTKK
ncbi:MAG: cytidylate kinase-like family protein [Lachnospiraceae bacterium]|nr:cytidylate kinase-like family protein [Lachnospiraceae bacterium]